MMALALSGCDAAYEMEAEIQKTLPPVPTIVPAGYWVSVGGEPVQVYGEDDCGNEGAFKCIVILPETKQIKVTMRTNGQLVEEQWTLERQGLVVNMRRPDGTYSLPLSQ
jgi:hypothetical protein